MGAVFHLNIEVFSSFEAYLSSYGQLDDKRQRALYSFMLNQRSNSLPETKPSNRYFALIFGNEATGLPDSFADITNTIFIPQTPLVDSLNLAIAAGVAMYHFRQELQKL